LWRGRRDEQQAPAADAAADAEDAGTDRDGVAGRPTRSHRHLRLVGEPDRTETPPPSFPLVDPLEAELALPAGSSLPPVPAFDRAPDDPPRDHQIATVLRDALANLRVDWD
ncbi:MAG: hypothetical protein ACR2O6_11520, partial [Ilumatobacteraceae bacterium]